MLNSLEQFTKRCYQTWEAKRLGLLPGWHLNATRRCSYSKHIGKLQTTICPVKYTNVFQYDKSSLRTVLWTRSNCFCLQGSAIYRKILIYTLKPYFRWFFWLFYRKNFKLSFLKKLFKFYFKILVPSVMKLYYPLDFSSVWNKFQIYGTITDSSNFLTLKSHLLTNTKQQIFLKKYPSLVYKNMCISTTSKIISYHYPYPIPYHIHI